MRIISKTHDYYDRYNDPASRVIYNRRKQEFYKATPGFFKGITIEMNHTKPFTPTRHWRNKGLLRYVLDNTSFKKGFVVRGSTEYFWLLIAGKLYPGIRLITSALEYTDIAREEKLYNLYSAGAVLKILTNTAKYTGYDKKELFTPKKVEQELIAYFSSTMDFEYACKIHLHYKSPIILLASRANGDVAEVTVDPGLKEIGFHKHLNPFLLYQAIDQFLGTVMVLEKNTPSKITDLDKIQQHGFDKKTSFRKM